MAANLYSKTTYIRRDPDLKRESQMGEIVHRHSHINQQAFQTIVNNFNQKKDSLSSHSSCMLILGQLPIFIYIFPIFLTGFMTYDGSACIDLHQYDTLLVLLIHMNI